MTCPGLAATMRAIRCGRSCRSRPQLRHARMEKPMGQRTPLYDQHCALGAKLVDFGGWDMPLHYGSQVEEHHQVRRDCGVFDDLIVYLTEPGYRVVVNAATRDKDLAWMQARAAGFAVELQERAELAMLAIQGPQARARTAELVNGPRAELIAALKPFQGFAQGDWFIARTGYTGEDGLEIILPAE